MKAQICSHITDKPSTMDERGRRLVNLERCDAVPIPGLAVCEEHCSKAELSALARWAHATAKLERLNVKALEDEAARLRVRIAELEAEKETRPGHCPGCDGDHA